MGNLAALVVLAVWCGAHALALAHTTHGGRKSAFPAVHHIRVLTQRQQQYTLSVNITRLTGVLHCTQGQACIAHASARPHGTPGTYTHTPRLPPPPPRAHTNRERPGGGRRHQQPCRHCHPNTTGACRAPAGTLHTPQRPARRRARHVCQRDARQPGLRGHGGSHRAHQAAQLPQRGRPRAAAGQQLGAQPAGGAGGVARHRQRHPRRARAGAPGAARRRAQPGGAVGVRQRRAADAGVPRGCGRGLRRWQRQPRPRAAAAARGVHEPHLHGCHDVWAAGQQLGLHGPRPHARCSHPGP
jgi:hypothetical protein